MHTNNPRENKKNSWIGLVVLLLFAAPELAIPLVIFGVIIWWAIQVVKKSQQGTPAGKQPRHENYDNCSQPVFCRHTDKSEHHVRRGKEIDPWDRPDIDISKYQRNR